MVDFNPQHNTQAYVQAMADNHVQVSDLTSPTRDTTVAPPREQHQTINHTAVAYVGLALLVALVVVVILAVFKGKDK